MHLFALAALLGCAASPVDLEDAALDDEQSSIDEVDASARRDADGDDGDALDGDTSDQELEASAEGGAIVTRDAARDAAGEGPRAVQDAGTARDANVESTPAPARDAAASVVDAASPTAPAARDASGPTSDASAADAAQRDAAMPGAPGNRCQKSSDCMALCAFTGILPCCREDHSCGCTWAPGAYCL